jgi:hypothetical protein
MCSALLRQFHYKKDVRASISMEVQGEVLISLNDDLVSPRQDREERHLNEKLGYQTCFCACEGSPRWLVIMVVHIPCPVRELIQPSEPSQMQFEMVMLRKPPLDSVPSSRQS